MRCCLQGYLSVNYSDNYYKLSQRFAEVPRLTAAHHEAMALFNELAQCAPLCVCAVRALTILLCMRSSPHAFFLVCFTCAICVFDPTSVMRASGGELHRQADWDTDRTLNPVRGTGPVASPAAVTACMHSEKGTGCRSGRTSSGWTTICSRATSSY